MGSAIETLVDSGLSQMFGSGSATSGILGNVVTSVANVVSDTLPFAVAVMAILLGVGLIPRLIRSFL